MKPDKLPMRRSRARARRHRPSAFAQDLDLTERDAPARLLCPERGGFRDIGPSDAGGRSGRVPDTLGFARAYSIEARHAHARQEG